MKYRKKPVVIEAVRFMIDDSLPDWFMERLAENTIITHENGSCDIKTLEGTMLANKGDFIILGVNGEVYPCKPDIFEKTYENEDGKLPKSCMQTEEINSLKEENNYLKMESDKSNAELCKYKEMYERRMRALNTDLESAKNVITAKNLVIAEMEVYKDFYKSVLHSNRCVGIRVG